MRRHAPGTCVVGLRKVGRRLRKKPQVREVWSGAVSTLELSAGELVMILQRVTMTSTGRVVEFARGVHAASRFSWSYTFTIPE